LVSAPTRQPYSKNRIAVNAMVFVYKEIAKTEKNKMKNYFKPKKFEFYRNKTIYEFVGIKIYKKYLPTTGDIVRKWRNIVQMKPNKSDRIHELYRYERKTRNYELRHIIGTIGFIALFLIIDKKLSSIDFVFLTALNFYVNIYPIFLQRHNRIRIIKVLLSNGQKSPYDK
jgi:glycosyl-4,4'-diaponeurosporenoate acyltransferase